MSTLHFFKSADNNASSWYHAIKLSSLSTITGPSTKIDYIYLVFNVPTANPAHIQVNSISFNAVWPEMNTPTITLTPLSGGNYRAEMSISFGSTITLGAINSIDIGISSDSAPFTPEQCLNSFQGALNGKPETSGWIEFRCPNAPAPEFVNVQPMVYVSGKKFMLEYGKSTTFELQPDTYSITTELLSLPNQTVYTEVQSNVQNILIETGKISVIDISFGPIVRHSVLEIKVGNIDELKTESLNISVYSDTTLLANFASNINETHYVKELAAQGSVKVCVMPFSLNNVDYSFAAKTIILNNTTIAVNVDATWITETPTATEGFIETSVKLTTTTPLDKKVVVRLSGNNMKYAALFNVASSTYKFPFPIKPGTYKLESDSFTEKMRLYNVNHDSAVDINKSNAVIAVNIEFTANLKVPGFPSFLAFGGCSDMQPSNEADFVQAKASVIFKYAGNDGAGDADVYLADDPAVTRTIAMARSVETKIGNGHITIPTMVSYTCNLSGGDAESILQKEERHNHSYANYILALTIACKNVDAKHPVAACFVLSPDFLGECEKVCDHYQTEPSKYEMPVIAPLQRAIDHCVAQKLIPNLQIPSDIENNIRGYVRSVNWLTRAVAGTKVCFGWQTNLWGVGRSGWVYEDKDVGAIGKKTADFAKSCGISSTDRYPVDFHAVDRYERDDFFQDSFINGYCYGPNEWSRYFDFCAAVCKNIKLPIMAWQIPASHIPLSTDDVNADFTTAQRWGTGGSYIFGHPELKNNVENINSKVSSFEFPAGRPVGNYRNMGELFSKPFDLSKAKYSDFALRGIFSVLLGGGATTGIISTVGDRSSWVRDKLNEYGNNPLKL